MIQVEQIYTHSSLRNFTYLIYTADGSMVLSIDPFDPAQVIRRLSELGLELTHIINTHEHGDHTCGNIGLVNRYNARVLAHPSAARQVPCFTQAIGAGERLALGDDVLEILDTPGHTFAHLSLLLRVNGQATAIFSGDTVFNAGVGNCYNGGDPAIMYQTMVDQYQLLEDQVQLYPGHDYLIHNLKFTLEYEPQNQIARKLLSTYQSRIQKKPNHFLVTTMGLERDISTFFHMDSAELKECLHKRFKDIGPHTSPKEIFMRLRKLRDDW